MRSTPTIESTTWWETPAACPARSRFWVVAVKNRCGASPSLSGLFKTSTIEWHPGTAASRPSPETTSTPADRETATPSWPWRPSAASTARPTRPVAPMTAILIRPSVHPSRGGEPPVGGAQDLRHAEVERLAEQLRLVGRAREDGHLGAEAGRDHV